MHVHAQRMCVCVGLFPGRHVFVCVCPDLPSVLPCSLHNCLQYCITLNQREREGNNRHRELIMCCAGAVWRTQSNYFKQIWKGKTSPQYLTSDLISITKTSSAGTKWWSLQLWKFKSLHLKQHPHWKVTTTQETEPFLMKSGASLESDGVAWWVHFTQV